MPTWLLIILIVLAVLVIGGIVARAMRNKRLESEFRSRLERANHDLAEAAAADKGWDRATLESAARRIYAEQRGTEPVELLLVEVLDRPGTDEDQAVFRAGGEGRQDTMTLGRSGGEWMLASLD